MQERDEWNQFTSVAMASVAAWIVSLLSLWGMWKLTTW